MVEVLLLLAIAAAGLVFAVRRSRRRMLLGRYTAFAIFEHIALPWLLFLFFGGVALALNSIAGFDAEGLIMLAQVAIWFGLVPIAVIFPPAILLLLILFAPAYLPFPVEFNVVVLFTLKAMWYLLGAAAFGNTIGLASERCKQRRSKGTCV